MNPHGVVFFSLRKKTTPQDVWKFNHRNVQSTSVLVPFHLFSLRSDMMSRTQYLEMTNVSVDLRKYNLNYYFDLVFFRNVFCAFAHFAFRWSYNEAHFWPYLHYFNLPSKHSDVSWVEKQTFLYLNLRYLSLFLAIVRWLWDSHGHLVLWTTIPLLF